MKKLWSRHSEPNPCLTKLFRTMRLSLFFLFVFAFEAIAIESYSQVTRLSVHQKDTRVIDVLQEIEDRSEFYFLFNQKLVDVERRVDIDASQKKIEEILHELFEDTNVNYLVMNRQIVLTTAQPAANQAPGAAQQQNLISGRVTDRLGLALPGVTIVIKGTTTGTISGSDGTYSIGNVPSTGVLVYSFVGMRAQEIEVNNRSVINIVLEEDAIGIEEVVAIGYGTQRRREVTSSIATVREEDFNRGAISSSPIQLVQGKIAGLAISRAHGGDPTRDVHILLRGVSTVRGDVSPLIIIDGVPGGNLNTIAPEDIESIDVLRDGSAAAIYGTRGNAGVIIITTKKGTPGKPMIAYSSYFYTETWSNKPSVLNAEQWKATKTNFQNSGNPLLQARAITLVDYGADTDWMAEITRKFPLSSVHNLSVTGGNESTSYFASLNYRDLEGFIKESNNNLLNGRISITHTGWQDRLMVQMNLSNAIKKSNPVDYQVYRQALGRNPTLPVYETDGKFFEIPGWEVRNPLAMLEQYQRDADRNDLLANVLVSLEIMKGLKLSTSGAIQRANEITGMYEQREALNSVMGGYKGSASRTTGLWQDRTLETTLNYNTTINKLNNISVLGGYSYQDFSYEGFGAGNRYFITDAFGYNNLGAGLHVPEGNYQSGDIWSTKRSSRLVAFFGRVNFNHADKYMLSASLRQEGSSKFGKDNKWGLFPAVSAGWTVSRESFMQDLTFIDNMKLRIGYGVTGNQGIDEYISLERLGAAGVMLYDGKWIPGYAPSSNPNPNLRWEKKTETNIGLDLTMFKDLSINLDLYDRKTTDLLYQYAVPVPPNLYNSLWTNVGEINNRGIELTMTKGLVSTKDFKWNTNFNISYNRNLLVSLSNDDFKHSHLDHTNLGAPGLNETNVFRLEEGQPIGNFFGWRFAEFNENGKWLFWNADNTQKLTSAQIRYEDKTIIGNGLPKTWVGFTNTFGYKNLDLSVALRGAFFFDLVNSRRTFYENVIMLPTNILTSALDSPLIDDPQFSDYYVEKGDYLKLDNVMIGYNVPVDNWSIKQIRFYVTGQNLYTFTSYQGQDPEIGITGLSPGIDFRWIYPSVKTFTVGVNVQF